MILPLPIARALRAARDSIHEAEAAIARARQATGTPEQVALAWLEAENAVAAVTNRGLADAVAAAKLDAMEAAILRDAKATGADDRHDSEATLVQLEVA